MSSNEVKICLILFLSLARCSLLSCAVFLYVLSLCELRIIYSVLLQCYIYWRVCMVFVCCQVYEFLNVFLSLSIVNENHSERKK